MTKIKDARKTGGKGGKLRLSKDTLKNLNAGSKARNVKGGRQGAAVESTGSAYICCQQ